MDISNGASRGAGRLYHALYSNDYSRDFRAWIVAGMALALAFVSTVLVVDDLLSGNYMLSAVIGILPCAMLLTLWLLVYRCEPTAAAAVLVASLYAVVALVLLVSGGHASGAYVAVPLVVLTASLVSPRKIATATAIACIVLLVCAAWLSTRAWPFPVAVSDEQFIWGMVRVSIIACTLSLVALLLYRKAADRTQSRLNAALARDAAASDVLSCLLDKHLSSLRLLCKLQDIGQLSGWWYDPASRRVHHTLSANGTLDEFGLDDPAGATPIQPISERALQTLIEAALSSGQSWDEEQLYPNATGEERWYRSIGEVSESSDGRRSVMGVFQEITDLRAAESQRAHSQKLEAMGTLAAGLAHEINTPIQYVSHNMSFVHESVAALHKLVSAFIDAVPDGGTDDQVKLRARLQGLANDADLDFLHEELPLALSETESGLQRISKIVQSMKSFAHPGQHEQASVKLHEAIEPTLRMAANSCASVADIETDFDETLPLVPCAPDQINQVVLNIIVNAADAIQAAGDRRGTIKVATGCDDTHAIISISDDGPGIPPDVRQRIFDPFFTTKEVGKGSGQGLSISYDVVVNGHRGELLCDSAPGRGTTFRIRLPLEPDLSKSTTGR